jgi:hypothetical protein
VESQRWVALVGIRNRNRGHIWITEKWHDSRDGAHANYAL